MSPRTGRALLTYITSIIHWAWWSSAAPDPSKPFQASKSFMWILERKSVPACEVTLAVFQTTASSMSLWVPNIIKVDCSQEFVLYMVDYMRDMGRGLVIVWLRVFSLSLFLDTWWLWFKYLPRICSIHLNLQKLKLCSKIPSKGNNDFKLRSADLFYIQKV